MTEGKTITLNGRYQLLSRVGSGGMAIVYKAKDLALGRHVAIKMLHDNLTGDSNFLTSFQREAHAAANLAHPNIVTVYDIGEAKGRHYIVLEFVEGSTLKQLIRQHKAEGTYLPLNSVLDITIQICEGIGYAHRAELVHCDVKPQNVLITPDQRVKVADFGIARAVTEATISQQSQSWGTPQYFSPEQAAGEKPTPSSDVYSIGIILFEMLTNELPFQAETPTGLAIKHLQTPPPLVTELNPLVPPQLAQIVNKVLSKEPSGRYRTAGQLASILRTYRERSQADTGSFNTAPQPVRPVSEQATQIYERPMTPQATGPTQPSPRRATPATAAPPPAQGTDWTAVGLGIVAVIALLGLIPLWFSVYQAWLP